MIDFPLRHRVGNISGEGLFKFRLIFIVPNGDLDQMNIGEGGSNGRGLDPGGQGLLFEARHIMVKIGAGLQRVARQSPHQQQCQPPLHFRSAFN